MLYVQHLRQLDYKHFELYAVGYAARKAFVSEKELKEEDLKTFITCSYTAFICRGISLQVLRFYSVTMIL